jgi:hypothetical protein
MKPVSPAGAAEGRIAVVDKEVIGIPGDQDGRAIAPAVV